MPNPDSAGHRLLVITSDIPVPANSGGRIEIWRQLGALKKAGFQVALICWFDDAGNGLPKSGDIDELRTVCDAVLTFPIRHSLRHFAERAVRALREPSHAAARSLSVDWPSVHSLLQEFRPRACLLYGLYGGTLATRLCRDHNLPLFYRSHNIEHLYMKAQFKRQRTWKKKLGLLANLVGLERYEKAVIHDSAVVFDISMTDCKFWEGELPGANVEWVAPVVDAEFLRGLAPQAAFQSDVLYFGNLHTPNNVEGLEWFIKEVRPLLPADLTIAVAGSRPTPFVRRLLEGVPNLKLFADPADMAPIVASSRVLINPVLAGSGVNIKSIEMLFTESQLVSTPVGVQGVPPDVQSCFSVETEPARFALRIERALAMGATVDAGTREHARSYFLADRFPSRVAYHLSRFDL